MSLTSALSVATQSLMAANGAIQIVNNNIANANTPGYTQEKATLTEAPPHEEGGFAQGSGVVFEGYQSLRNELLQGQLQQQTQAQSSADAQLTTLQQVQQVFTTSSSDIGTQMSALFASLSSLSTSPTSATQRQAVLSAAQGLAGAFNSASQQLTQQQTALNAQVSQDVSTINQLAQQIAALNPQIAAANRQGQDAGTLQDQQDQLVLQLSKVAGASVTRTSDGITVSVGGAAVVVGAKSFALTATTTASGLAAVSDANGADVTASLGGGDLGGVLTTQQTTIPGLQAKLDALANDFGTAFNNAQAAGFDQNGQPGAAFFSLPATVTGAAGAIAVALSSTTQIAASSDGAVGSNGNLASFEAIQNSPLGGGATPGDTYAALVFQVGQMTANVKAASSAAQTGVLQLTNQISSVSGVSIDQETTTLMQYQQAYEAAARVVSTIEALFQVTLSMGTASAS